MIGLTLFSPQLKFNQMKNKHIANGLIGALIVVVMAVTVNNNESWVAIGGIGVWVFGIWSIVRLYKLPDPTNS